MNKPFLVASSLSTALLLMAGFVMSFSASGELSALNSNAVRGLLLFAIAMDVIATAHALRAGSTQQDEKQG